MKRRRPKLEYRNRGQIHLGMVDPDNLIEEWHPARAVWAVLEGLDFSRRWQAAEKGPLPHQGIRGIGRLRPRFCDRTGYFGDLPEEFRQRFNEHWLVERLHFQCPRQAYEPAA